MPFFVFASSALILRPETNYGISFLHLKNNPAGRIVQVYGAVNCQKS
jgi:hypothetical protein